MSGLKSSLFYPMMTDPGTRWGYGIGIDWLGQVVERIDGRRIDKFCRDEIFDPLGMSDTAFEPSDAMRERLAWSPPAARMANWRLSISRRQPIPRFMEWATRFIRRRRTI